MKRDTEGSMNGPSVPQMATRSSELKSALWAAANTLRGSAVDRTDWKGYILPLYSSNASPTSGTKRRPKHRRSMARPIYRCFQSPPPRRGGFVAEVNGGLLAARSSGATTKRVTYTNQRLRQRLLKRDPSFRRARRLPLERCSGGAGQRGRRATPGDAGNLNAQILTRCFECSETLTGVTRKSSPTNS